MGKEWHWVVVCRLLAFSNNRVHHGLRVLVGPRNSSAALEDVEDDVEQVSCPTYSPYLRCPCALGHCCVYARGAGYVSGGGLINYRNKMKDVCYLPR